MMLQPVSVCAALIGGAMVVRVRVPSFTSHTRLTAVLGSAEDSPMPHHFSCAVECDNVFGGWGWTSGVGLGGVLAEDMCVWRACFHRSAGEI